MHDIVAGILYCDLFTIGSKPLKPWADLRTGSKRRGLARLKNGPAKRLVAQQPNREQHYQRLPSCSELVTVRTCSLRGTLLRYLPTKISSSNSYQQIIGSLTEAVGLSARKLGKVHRTRVFTSKVLHPTTRLELSPTMFIRNYGLTIATRRSGLVRLEGRCAHHHDTYLPIHLYGTAADGAIA